MAIIDWHTTDAAVVAALPTASTVEQAIVAPLLARMRALGEVYDVIGSPDVLNESAEHANWRTTRETAAVELDAIAAALEAAFPPAEPPDGWGVPDPSANMTKVRARLEKAPARTTSLGELARLRPHP